MYISDTCRKLHHSICLLSAAGLKQEKGFYYFVFAGATTWECLCFMHGHEWRWCFSVSPLPNLSDGILMYTTTGMPLLPTYHVFPLHMVVLSTGGITFQFL